MNIPSKFFFLSFSTCLKSFLGANFENNHEYTFKKNILGSRLTVSNVFRGVEFDNEYTFEKIHCSCSACVENFLGCRL